MNEHKKLYENLCKDCITKNICEVYKKIDFLRDRFNTDIKVSAIKCKYFIK